MGPKASCQQRLSLANDLNAINIVVEKKNKKKVIAARSWIHYIFSFLVCCPRNSSDTFVISWFLSFKVTRPSLLKYSRCFETPANSWVRDDFYHFRLCIKYHIALINLFELWIKLGFRKSFQEAGFEKSIGWGYMVRKQRKKQREDETFRVN